MENSYQIQGQLARRLRRDGTPWIKYGIIAAVFAMSITLALLDAQILTMLVILGILGIGAFLVLIRWPGLNMVLIIVACLLVPISLRIGGNRLNAAMIAVAILGCIWIVDLVAQRRHILIAESRPLFYLFVFIIIALLAFLGGQIHWLPFAQNAPIQAQIGGMGLLFLSILAFYIIAHQIKEVRWLEWAVWLFIVLGGIFVVGWLIPGGRRVMNTIFQYGSTSSQFWIWMVSFTLSMVIFNHNLKKVSRLLLLGLVLIIFLAASTLTGWKSGWFPAVFSVLFLLSQFSRKLALLLIFGGLIISPIIAREIIQSDEFSYVTRIQIWYSLLDLIEKNPISGLGPANYYHYTPFLTVMGYSSLHYSSHNQYVDILIQFGLVGLVFFLLFIFELFRLGWRLRNKVPQGFPRAYVFGALAGLIGTVITGMLGDWIVPFVYNIGFVGFRASVYGWMFLGGLIALDQILMKPREDTKI